MKRLVMLAVVVGALAVPVAATAHEGADPDWPYNYCGFADGAFDGQGHFDRYEATWVVTPGAPSDPPPRPRVVYHEVAHFGPGGWEYTNLEFCRWSSW